MPPDEYAAESGDALAGILRHLAEIGAGRISITDADLAEAPTDVMRELLVGLLTLHEDLQYERGLRAIAEQQSDRLVADLRAAVAARDEFLSVASHELRTPLSTLKLQTAAVSRWLARTPMPEHEPALAKNFAVIDRQVARLEKLMAELLDVSRLTSGRFELLRERVDLVPLVREVVDRFRSDHGQSTPELLFESDPHVVGEWDPFRLDQVASNLVANAIRYGEGKPVHVAVRGTGDAGCIVVRDEGIGIAADQKERIFERFERAVSSSNYGGLGLGLWIVKQIVDAHAGTIDVESEPGRGALFTVTLPLAPQHPGAST